MVKIIIRKGERMNSKICHECISKRVRLPVPQPVMNVHRIMENTKRQG